MNVFFSLVWRLKYLNCCIVLFKSFINSSPPVPLVFRNQLPRRNDFYSYEPPSEDPPSETGESVHLQLKSGAHLCRVCGCSGPKRCSRCHKAHYCSKEHQSLDWRLGHKQACAQTGESILFLFLNISSLSSCLEARSFILRIKVNIRKGVIIFRILVN